MTTYAYCRVSTITQVIGKKGKAKEPVGLSLEVQERQLEGWAMMNETTIDRVFVEKAVSGSVPINDRPMGKALMERLRKGDTVVAVKLDRMFRSALDAFQTVEVFRAKGISLVLLDLGGDVVSNGMSKMFLTITAAFAEAERDRIRERIQGSKADAKARGRYLGGKVPFGYGVGSDGALVPIPDEQAIIKAAQAMRDEWSPLRTIQTTIAIQYGKRLSLDALSRIVGPPQSRCT